MENRLTQPTFLFYDYETFGSHPAFDRPVQFASIRTDSRFKTLGDPVVFFCCPADDYLPEPEAVLITGISPQKMLRDGVIEAKFARRIHEIFKIPKTCILGYNNIRFDDEFTRHLFYRNFYDPYSWSWQQGNSRWDLLDVVRACYALRPEGIEWPLNKHGLPSFRLEHLTCANGIEHANAHDAMGDVYATLAMAKLMFHAQPKLFDYLCRHRDKHKLKMLVDIETMKPLVHVSGMFGSVRGNIALIAPIAWHPINANILIACDLSGDMSLLEDMDSDELRTRLYTQRDKLSVNAAVPLQLVHFNKCPVLVPANTLRSMDAERFGIYPQRCQDNLIWLRNRPKIKNKVVAIFSRNTLFTYSNDLDAQLYENFFSDTDRIAMNIVLATAPENLSALDISFVDPRLKPLLFRYRARNFPNTLDYDEKSRWLEHRKSRFTQSRMESYMQCLETLCLSYAGDGKKLQLLHALLEYSQMLYS
ncbi:MAG: exodeoxyribonuclease I [Sodalis sp. (in: enterobacteria)]